MLCKIIYWFYEFFGIGQKFRAENEKCHIYLYGITANKLINTNYDMFNGHSN